MMDDDKASQIEGLIREHVCDGELCVKFVSHALGLSQSRLCELSHRYWGMNMKQFIDTVRVDYALRLFKDGGTLYEVASRCGFSDTRTFRRVFKKRTGMSPAEARERLGKLNNELPELEEEDLLRSLWSSKEVESIIVR